MNEEYVVLSSDWKGKVHPVYYLRKPAEDGKFAFDNSIIIVVGFTVNKNSTDIIYVVDNLNVLVYESGKTDMDSAWEMFLKDHPGYVRAVRRDTIHKA